MTTLYHNPRCSKSRQALQLLEEEGETIEIVKYLENPPTHQELKQVIELLGIDPIELVRKQEAEWRENYKGKNLTNEEVIDAMIQHPKLIERPIAIKGTHAVVGRPPEKVLDIL
ncbi:arsenate reductase (glutaredoxin) [Aequorivita vladivostokensis]|jgi:arsenate reductase|uniref:Arsenate reductase n=1 Tax=Aequorivita vladivostokensis TaxID=171194 RepID=A0ABR5DKD8_9FLAO|nr:arsenate reductase (glutaredoxin) [Aequorivita vladivostokensis]KJJ39247.1 arsenate reductase [Aequorivita vladivostokensis]